MDHHHAIRSGIIDKLKDFNAYIDNELPDYIMVMLANKKTMNQISTDLQLFLGENTDQFIDWLKKVVSDPSLLTREDSPSSSLDHTHSLSPVRKRSSSQTSSQSNSVSRRRRSSSLDRPVKVSRQDDKNEHDDEHDDDVVPAATIQRIKLPPEEKKYTNNTNNEHYRKGESGRGTRGGDEPRRSRDQDLRSLIRRRKAESGISDESRVVSSVVQVPDKPDRPRESRGTSRLLQRAIHDIHGRHSSKRGERRGGRERERDQRGARTQNKSEETHKEEVLVDEADYVNDLHNNDGGKEEEYENDTVTITAPLTNEDEVGEKHEAMSEKDDNEQLKAITPEKVEAATIAAIRKVLPTEDLRLFLNKGKSVNKSSSDNSGTGTRFIVKMDDTAMEGEEEEEEEGEESARQGKGGLSERCRFWPNCKNGDSCPFHHPTVPCRMFPNCKFGQKCCFVHPVCKFDGRCMKPDCPYLHTVPKPKAMASRVMAAPFRMPPPFMLGGASMMYIGGGVGGRASHRYPNKQSLKWTPNKHLSERKFAVADSDTSSMSVQ